MKQVYAKWFIKTLPEDMDEFHISCGIKDGRGDEQLMGYFISDDGAKLTIEKIEDGYDVIFTTPSLQLEESEGYWLSPSLINAGVEAIEWGIK